MAQQPPQQEPQPQLTQHWRKQLLMDGGRQLHLTRQSAHSGTLHPKHCTQLAVHPRRQLAQGEQHLASQATRQEQSKHEPHEAHTLEQQSTTQPHRKNLSTGSQHARNPTLQLEKKSPIEPKKIAIEAKKEKVTSISPALERIIAGILLSRDLPFSP